MDYKTNVAKFLYFLKNYGHARIVFPADEEDTSINFVYVFVITKEGSLGVNVYRYMFDKTFFTDHIVEPDAQPIRRKFVFDTSRFFRIPLREIILSDFNGNIIGANENIKNVNYNEDVLKELFFLFSSALEVTDERLANVANKKEKLSQVLKPIAKDESLIEEYDEETFIEKIEEKMLDVKRRLYDLGYEEYNSQLHLDIPGVVFDDRKKKNKKPIK